MKDTRNKPECDFGYDIRQRTKVLEGQVKDMDSKVDKMYRWMVKNGLKDDIAEIKEMRQEQRDWKKFLKRTVITTSLTAFFGGIATGILWALGIVP